MVEEGDVAGAELVSGAAGAAGAAVLSGGDDLGGGTGPMRAFVSGAGAAEGEAGNSFEFSACSEAVRLTS